MRIKFYVSEAHLNKIFQYRNILTIYERIPFLTELNNCEPIQIATTLVKIAIVCMNNITEQLSLLNTFYCNLFLSGS